jgi:hypothetical protein
MPRPLYPRERPGNHCTGGWVRPRAGLDVFEKSRPHRDSIPGPSSLYPVDIPTELPGPPQHGTLAKYKAWMCRKIPWELPCWGKPCNRHSVLKSICFMHAFNFLQGTKRNFIGELEVTTMSNVRHQPRPVGYETRIFLMPHVPYGLRNLPSRLWPKCNRLLWLRRSWGAVTLSRWGGWWYMNMKYKEGPKT